MSLVFIYFDKKLHAQMDFDDMFGGEAEHGGAGNELADDLFMFTGMNAEEIEAYKDMKDSVIFLIDCHRSMYAQN